MKLSKLLDKLNYSVTAGNSDTIVNPESVEIQDVVNDNRKIGEGSLFICIKGANFDGHSCAAQAAEKKAAAIVAEHEVELPEGCTMPVIRVEDTRYAMAFISAAYFDHPAQKLKTIGITGTKGKTTTTYLIKSMLENAGHKVGLIGTIEVIIGDEHIHAENTTPESYDLQKYMAKMVEAGCDSVVMEVSSQGLMLHRSQGFIYDLGIFTNIEPDHIGPNEHKDFEDYMHCKGLLFKQCKVGICNGDDIHTDDILEGHTCEVETYGFNEGVDLRAINLAYIRKPGELGVFFDTEGLLDMHAEIRTPGKFSVYNALCAIAVARHFDCTPEEIAAALKEAKVKGRIEMVKVSDEFTLMIDYAHNAMALKSLLSTLREYHPNRLISVFGCGGNRSKLRRFEMGEVSGKFADFTIITSDNPRFEEPEDIMNDIETGMKKTDGKYIKITDRKEAIAYAIDHGEHGDIIVLAGKGHEDYQEIKGVKYHMDERELIQEILEERK
ncbi:MULTISPECIES: UDP-N-acetylmuramoyl-L-alanyl-D-glutamate--2,6-diaminopimelate ligase [unclassified Butyrivibrio]|uniref:UDP-N-acetylmuramoyl-L-alanyl-D-glutamate--2, 6-diaminopimelate ligase n=1 Tax=unclassified Butyrivibrio TaxID=2639466 RepID=UPI0003B55B39|nr:MULTISPECIES: UDP-N-acetylmuramoyl-L-alanyl-D-glutamate--2,6-diaminopimelate ligase [unclassified Butyrivibrio]MDC7294202.1 UDP-N-acetylmuramoyl-L-alanyl-D-glutamate--2,6-diaminopimelate ligase [Butyrivibrio sp. DSM 10294]